MPSFQEIQSLFLEALARPASERDAFLHATTAESPALREAVRELLDADQDETPFELDRPLARLPAPEPEDPRGRQIGPYLLDRVLGHGGMGTVYLARHRDLGRLVALKTVRDGALAGSLRQRFDVEQRTLARLEHPDIARLYDVGLAADGSPYFAMEYVQGLPVTAFADGRGLGVPERVRLMLRIARAVAHAHARFVIHLDLKPSNVLVTESGAPRLLDFGIAATLGEAQQRDLPRATPSYAAPETLRGAPPTATADVYALGVMLYELLCGTRPPASEAPPLPSALAPPGRRRQLRGDLDAIALRAIAPEPERRLPTAEALADDLERYLGAVPVRSRPQTVGIRASRFAWRNRLALSIAGGVAVILSLVVGAAGMRLQAERDRARQQAARAETVLGSVLGLFESADPREDAAALDVAAFLDRGADRARAMNAPPADRAALLTAMFRANVGLGRDSAARAALADALAQYAAAGDDAGVGRTLVDLGWLDLRRGDAEAAHRQFAAGAERLRRSEPAAVPGATHGLALALNGIGRPEQAEEALREALARLQRLADRSPREEANMLNDLGLIRHARGDDADAERLLANALRLRREALGPDDLDVASGLLLAGWFRQRAGDRPEAASLYAESLRIRRARLPDGHPLIREAQDALAEVSEERIAE